MQQRKPAAVNGRPSGTDGSDFSYRMVVDSRYTKVAKAKSRLSALIFTQAIVQLVGVASLLLSISKEEGPNTLVISSTAISFLSLFVGEIGRRRSRVNLLRFYMFASSIAVMISIAWVGSSNFLAEVYLGFVHGAFCGLPPFFMSFGFCASPLLAPLYLYYVPYLSTASYRLSVIRDQSRWQTEKFVLFSIAGVLLGLLLQILAVRTTISLIHNMSPPKRAS